MAQEVDSLRCPKCHGSGSIASYCRVCAGTGVIRRAGEEITCRRCGGSGVSIGICSFCSSSGYIRNKDAEFFLSVEGTNADEVQQVASALLGGAQAMSVKQKEHSTRVLVVFANPKGTDQLRLSTEDRIIRECVKLSKSRDNIILDILHAATIHDVRRALLEHDYRIVHFSGHGTGKGLAFENELGNMYVVPPEALAEFVSAYSPPIECVILNACYSRSQGELLTLGIPHTIAAEGPISDSGAMEFTRGFYDAIGAGKSVEFAYQEGCRTIKLTGHKSSDTPVLLSAGSVGPG